MPEYEHLLKALGYNFSCIDKREFYHSSHLSGVNGDYSVWNRIKLIEFSIQMQKTDTETDVFNLEGTL